MKNSVIKKITVIAFVMCLCFSYAVGSYAALPDDNIVQPQYTALKSCDCGLSKASGGLKCTGGTYTATGYVAAVRVELQQYDGGWDTVKTWNKRGSSTAAEVNETYYPESGYRYRVYTIHQAYNSSGTLVEIDTMYSTEVYY